MDRRTFLGAASLGLAGLAAKDEALGANTHIPYRRIACEEGFLTAGVAAANARLGDIGVPLITVDGPAAFLARLLTDLGDGRIAAMDEAGVDMQLLVLSAPGVQVFDPATATSLAKDANDEVSEACRRHSDRFAALAAIPPQAPEAAAKELERAVTKLGLKGAVINSHTNGAYLDEPQFAPIFEALQALNAPLYIHPRDPVPGIAQYMTNAVVAGAAWAYAVEVGTHALRLIGSGLFDKYPKLRIVIGHMGEGVPFWLPRIDNRYQARIGPPGGASLELLPSEYFRRNFFVTTSGMNYEAPLRMTTDVLGTDKVMFAADYPFEKHGDAVQAVEGMSLDDATRSAFFEGNAVRVFDL